MRDPWVLRCPEGHSSVTVYEETYKCDTCGETYAGGPYDARETDFPADDEPLASDIETQILEDLVEQCDDPTTYTRRAFQIDVGTPHQIGNILPALEDEGLVARTGTGNNGHHWRPTEKGVQRVRQLETAESPDRARAQVTPLDTVKLFGAVAAIAILVMVLGGAL